MRLIEVLVVQYLTVCYALLLLFLKIADLKSVFSYDVCCEMYVCVWIVLYMNRRTFGHIFFYFLSTVTKVHNQSHDVVVADLFTSCF